jgi:DNA repair protein RadC
MRICHEHIRRNIMQPITFIHERLEARQTYLPPSEHPLLRVAESPAGCNLVELLAAQIGGARALNTAQVLLAHYGSPAAISIHSPQELMALTEISRRAAVRLLAALELGRRMMQNDNDKSVVIRQPSDVASLVQYDLERLEQEELWVLLLNTHHRLLSIDHLYRGSVNSSQIRVGEVFRSAIRRNAVAIVLAHNHPGADPSPSPEDFSVTQAIAAAGKQLDIDLLDHLIFGGGQYVSLKESGFLAG